MPYTTESRKALFVFCLILFLAGGVGSVGHAAQRGLTPLTALAPPVALLELPIDSASGHERLAELGLDVVAERPGAWVRVLAWPGDREILRDAGIGYEVLEEDWGRSLARVRSVPLKPAPRRAASVPAFGDGSLAGFYTLSEVEAYIDSIAANDAAGIVSSPVYVGTSTQGRPIRAIRIASDSQPDHTRPRVLYTALTHAREPGGMQSLVYFMNWLLQGFGVDPAVTYLVNQREMWFVLVVNPDGYAINEATYFGSGSYGMWRKNARDNDGNNVINSQDGVDLNRNYGFQWGYDNVGSSPTPSSTTYRGPSAFSEPETQAVRDFCVLHGFRMAQNFHTYWETTLYPWAYSGTASPDDPYYVRLVDDMMREAHYSYGISIEILYAVNGDANDWMYGEQSTKPKVFAMTTEAGNQNDGFWPTASRILPIAHVNLRSNAVLAYAAGTYVRTAAAEIVSTDGWLHPNGSAEVALVLRNDGLDPTNGVVTVTATTDAAGVTITDAVSTFPGLNPGDTAYPEAADRLALYAAAGVAAGTVVPLYLEIHDAGSYVLRDTTSITVGTPLVVFADDASGGLVNWAATGGWGTQTVDGNPRFTDSPAGDYAPNVDSRLSLLAPLDLSGGAAAFLEFTTRWWIEGGYDFGRVEVSTNAGASWTALAGRWTRAGHGSLGQYAGGTQPAGVPGYDNTKRIWAQERIDLSAYAGLADVRLRFRLTSDSGVQEDGWLVDDVRVLVYPDDVTGVGGTGAGAPRVALEPGGANPFRTSARFIATFAAPTRFRAAVYSVDGRLVRVLAAGIASPGSRELVWDGRGADGTTVAAGAYLFRVDSDAGSLTRRVVHIH